MIVKDAHGRVVYDREIGAALGKGLDADRLLPRENRKEAVRALRVFISAAGRYGIAASEIQLIATAAVRNAKGRVRAAARIAGKTTGRRFLEDVVRGQLGLTRAKVISGRREALLGFKGALVGWTGPTTGRFVVYDLGGSSHQVTVGTRRKVERAGSTQIGSNFVAEKILVDDQGRPLDVMTASQLAQADARMAQAIRRLPIEGPLPRDATMILLGDVSRFLSYYYRKDQVTLDEVAALRDQVAKMPASSRSQRVRADAKGRPFTQPERARLGLHDSEAGGDDYGVKLPAKLTLLLRIMALSESRVVHLANTDGRHALLE
jgi:exopolyphosphatase/pppGpp-phosphohydrolase